MPAGSQDIYRSRRREEKDAGPDRSLRDQAEWLQRTSRNRLTTFVFAVGVLIFLVILVGVILFQQRLIRDARQVANENVENPPPLAVVPRPIHPLDVDASGRVIYDELQDVTPAELPAEGPLPLTAGWVKQAAYFLQRAELAYGGEHWQEAVANYEKALRILPDLQGVTGNLGLCYLRMEKYEEAEREFQREAQHEPASSAILNDLGVALMGQGKSSEAEAVYRKAIAANESYAPAYYNLGLLYYRDGALDKAAEIFATAAQLDPDNVDVLNMRAMALMQLGQWKAAATVLRHSSNMLPEAAPVRFRLAEALSHTPDQDAAMAALTKAVGLVDARNALQWMNRKQFDLLRDRQDFQQLVADLTEAMR